MLGSMGRLSQVRLFYRLVKAGQDSVKDSIGDFGKSRCENCPSGPWPLERCPPSLVGHEASIIPMMGNPLPNRIHDSTWRLMNSFSTHAFAKAIHRGRQSCIGIIGWFSCIIT